MLGWVIVGLAQPNWPNYEPLLLTEPGLNLGTGWAGSSLSLIGPTWASPDKLGLGQFLS